MYKKFRFLFITFLFLLSFSSLAFAEEPPPGYEEPFRVLEIFTYIPAIIFSIYYCHPIVFVFLFPLTTIYLGYVHVKGLKNTVKAEDQKKKIKQYLWLYISAVLCIFFGSINVFYFPVITFFNFDSSEFLLYSAIITTVFLGLASAVIIMHTILTNLYFGITKLFPKKKSQSSIDTSNKEIYNKIE